MNLISYLRVSTKGQGDSGLGVEAQRETVRRYAAGRGTIQQEFVEVDSGRRQDRPQLAAAIKACRHTRAVLVVSKLDRLSRDVHFLLRIIDCGVPVMFCDLPMLGTMEPAVGRLILTVMGALAEFEAKRISQRTKDALAVRRAQGKKLGNPANLTNANRKLGAIVAGRAKAERARAYYLDLMPAICDWRAEGKSLREIARTLNDKGVLTMLGRPWMIAQVKRVLDHYAGAA